MDYEALYNMYYMQVFSYVMTLTHSKDQAEEITQETFSRALFSDKGFRKESGELTWLCSIAKNFFIDENRKKKRFVDLPEDYELVDESSLQTDVEDADASYRIHMILHDLEEPYKEVFQLRVFGELSFQKIGTIFGKTETWARVTFHRAKLKISERMENENGSKL